MITRRLASQIDAWIAERETGPRSPGFHVSGLVLAMLKEVAPKKYADYGSGGDDKRKPIYEMGYVWEDTLGAVLSPRVLLDEGEVLVATQTEIERDGIFGTPDRQVLTRRAALVVEETKITWKWYDDDIEHLKFLYWVLQVKTYCAMLGALQARIRALFINELHAGQFVVPGCWELTFQPHELDEWWESVTRFAAAHPELETAA